MSLEQARGVAVNERSDLFSLGSLIYAMWTGHSPFRAETSFGVLHEPESPFRAVFEMHMPNGDPSESAQGRRTAECPDDLLP